MRGEYSKVGFGTVDRIDVSILSQRLLALLLLVGLQCCACITREDIRTDNHSGNRLKYVWSMTAFSQIQDFVYFSSKSSNLIPISKSTS